MKILFLVNALKYGGAERVCSELASFFSKNNDVTILITSAKSYIDYDVGNAKIAYLRNGEYVRPIFKTHLCRKWMKKNKPDVVIAFPDPCSYYGAAAAKRLRIPCICSERNAPMFQPEGRIMRHLRMSAYRKANAIVFQTDLARKWFPTSIQNKGFVIWNPYDNVNGKNDIGDTLDSIVTAGRIVPQKNHKLLIEAFDIFHKKHPNVDLHIYGTGGDDLLNSLKEEISTLKLDDKVVFKGFSRDLRSTLSNYPVFVLSSNHEGMPNALLEAAISGCSCVSTDCLVGGPREILEGCPSHRLVKCDDVEGLATAMELAYENREREKNAAFEHSQYLLSETTIDVIAGKWQELINSCLDKRRKKR